jgi:hypothetical protein
MLKMEDVTVAGDEVCAGRFCNTLFMPEPATWSLGFGRR